ncbi:MAG: anti-sigma factor [Planctomycetaceae bacterium]
MNNQPLPENDRLLELLATYATDSLTGEEVAELRALLQEADGVEEDDFELAAAAMHLAMNNANHALPDEVVDKVLSDANDYFTKNVKPTTPAPAVGAVSSFNLREALAWFIAAAAVVFAFSSQQKEVVQPPTEVVQRSNEEVRDALIANPNTVQWDWIATEDPSAINASGDIVWNNDKQKGFMKITNLQPNDVTECCYQLWIFDKNQEHPIDGGIFNITSADQLIPIEAKLKVNQFFQFAVTVEKPDGVVVSDQERVPLLAKL